MAKDLLLANEIERLKREKVLAWWNGFLTKFSLNREIEHLRAEGTDQHRKREQVAAQPAGDHMLVNFIIGATEKDCKPEDVDRVRTLERKIEELLKKIKILEETALKESEERALIDRNHNHEKEELLNTIKILEKAAAEKSQEHAGRIRAFEKEKKISEETAIKRADERAEMDHITREGILLETDFSS